jgi:hypothetical protein
LLLILDACFHDLPMVRSHVAVLLILLLFKLFPMICQWFRIVQRLCRDTLLSTIYVVYSSYIVNDLELCNTYVKILFWVQYTFFVAHMLSIILNCATYMQDTLWVHICCLYFWARTLSMIRIVRQLCRDTISSTKYIICSLYAVNDLELCSINVEMFIVQKYEKF